MNINQVVAAVAGDRQVRRSGGGYMVPCPVHGAGGGDSNPSLEISVGTSQPIVFRCHAGCETEDILAAAGLTWDQISAERTEAPATSREWMPGGVTHQETYEYMDASGNLVWQVLRTTDKQFFQRHPDPGGPHGWRWVAPPLNERVLYRLPQVLEAVAGGHEIWFPEGERDVHALERAGVIATTSAGGAKAWSPHYAESLRGARVTIVADCDEAGRQHARAKRASLLEVECQARIVEAKQGKDARDHLEVHGLTLDDFLETVPYEEEPVYDLAPTLGEYLGESPGTRVWVIPGMLAEREVCMVTGYEGHGKSSFMKQVCVQAAAGVHPFSLRRIDPIKVLFVDLENPKIDNFEDFQKLARIARQHSDVDPGTNMHILESRPANLATSEGAAWLIERVHAHRPQLITIGPLYNMMGEDASAEAAVRPVKDVLDYIREKYKCAIFIEHHVPHRSGDVRDVRPIGSSILMRWPAFGFGLAPINEPLQPGEHKPKPTGVYEWSAWRGPRRRDRYWPSHLRWGLADSAEWMWMEAEPDVVAEAMSRAKGAKG